ncbi:MAG: transcriptional regulator, partial [Mogibacterium sp.]|nr:transcriptional regulator [Mogibacterium sp.]
MNVKSFLKPYVAVADMIANTFGKDCEVVVHDLENPEHSVVYVANNRVTGREIGQSFYTLVSEVMLSEELIDDHADNYYFTAANGKLIRSSTLMIRDASGEVAGAICINLDTSRITQQIEYLQSFMPNREKHEVTNKKETSASESNISVLVDDLIHRIAGSSPVETMSRDQRIEKVRFMEEKGIFLMKGSVEKAAEELGVNKVTIYSYLDE